MPTLMPCANMFNTLPEDKHCPYHSLILPEETSLTFYYVGRAFNIIKPLRQCSTCAVEYAKYMYNQHCERGILRDNAVNWTYIRRLRRKKKSHRALAIPQMDEEYRAIQVLHDIGVLTQDSVSGWEVRDLSGVGDGSHVCPSYYRRMKLYFVDLRDAIRYCKTCLAPKWGFYKFEVRKGDVVHSQKEILGKRRASSGRGTACF